MTTPELTTQLLTKHREFAEAVAQLDNTAFTTAVNGKWTPGQQLEHIYLSVAPLTKALGYPKFIPRLLFGKNNRASRDYAAMIAKYKEALDKGGKASGEFVPKEVGAGRKDALKAKLIHNVENLNQRVATFSEEQLDTLLLPHPLLGKLTIREMLYFTLYHVQHHHEMTLKNLAVKV